MTSKRWKQYIKERIRVSSSGCWEWQCSKTGNGYGHCKVDGKVVSTHRLAFLLWNGPIKRGQIVRHKCDNAACCNPKHLEPGWHEDNTQDIVTRKRSRSNRFSEQDVLGMISAFDLGESVVSISARLHTDTRIVKGFLLKAGREMRHLGRPKGSKNIRVRITDDVKEKIRKAYSTGRFTQQQLAVRFGCDQTYVSMLVHH